MLGEDGEYAGYTEDPERLAVFDELQKKRNGVWINRGKFITLDSGRRVYTSDVYINCSDDFDELLKVDPADVLPCDTLLDGYKHFLTDLNARGVYAVGSVSLATKVLGIGPGGYDESALRQEVANMNVKRSWTLVTPTRIALGTRMTGRRRRNKDVIRITTVGSLADMADVRDIVRHKDLLLPAVRSEVVGDNATLQAVELEPNLASNDRNVLRYVTRKAPPGGYAPKLNKPVVALAYTASLTGDPVHIANAICRALREACHAELFDRPHFLKLDGDERDLSWLSSYAAVVLWWRRLNKLPTAMRDLAALLLPGAGHLDRTGVAVAIANHVLHLAPLIRRAFSDVNTVVFVLTISMLWRILRETRYAKWRKLHADVLARHKLPVDAAAKVIAAEFCAYAPRVAGGAVCAVDRLCANDYSGYDMTKAKADVVAFLLEYAPKGSAVRQS